MVKEDYAARGLVPLYQNPSFLYPTGMKGLDVIIQTGISIAFLLQYYGIGLLYGKKPTPALKLYKRMVLCFVAVTGASAAHLLANGWLFNLHITNFSRLFIMYEHERHAAAQTAFSLSYIAVNTALDLLNPAWFLLLFPPIIIELIRMEDIPISRLQLRLKNLTLTVGVLCVVFYIIFPLLQTLNDFGFLAAGSLPARTLTFFYRFVSVIFFIMYAFFVAWAVHACKVRILTPFPFIQKVFYRVMRIAGIICGWIFIGSIPTLLHNFDIPVGVCAVFLSRSVPFPFYEDLMLYGLFAAAGLYVLHHQAQQRFNGAHTEDQNAPVQPMRVCRNDTAADTAASKTAAKGFDTAHGVTGNAFIIEETDEIKQRYRRFFIEQGLTEREADVAVLIAFAKSNKEIAVELNIAYNTVKNHIANVYKKTGAHNRFDLARFANTGIAVV